MHVNFGQLGFVFIEANVKKWGLAPMTGSLAPPPPYGSEQGSILLEGGREGVREGAAGGAASAPAGYMVSRSSRHPPSPGPQRSPTDISLAQFSLIDPRELEADDAGEGTSGAARARALAAHPGHPAMPFEGAPPEYESPGSSPDAERGGRLGDDERGGVEERPLLGRATSEGELDPPIPSYDAAVAEGGWVRREGV